VVPKSFVPNDYFDLIRETVGEEMIEEVKLLDEYENDTKFGSDKKSYAYRIIYRSLDKTLTGAEVDALHKKLEERTKEAYGAVIR
jgi:phenylalanyl-tRNA synthetase alpha chain